MTDFKQPSALTPVESFNSTSTTLPPLTDADLKLLANQPHAYALTNAQVLATITSLTTRAEAAEAALEIQKGAVEIQGGELARATEEYAKVLARAASLEAELKRADKGWADCQQECASLRGVLALSPTPTELGP